jgi:general secretion pathway protein L
MELMLLRLTDDQNNIEYTLFNKQENIASISKTTTINEVIAEATTHDAIILAVSGFDVIAIEKSLPKMPINKLIKALPFAIEDQLLEPVDNYHIVITQIQDNGNVSLLAVLRNKMQQWLNTFHKHITFSSMLPDYLLLPYGIDAWHIVIEKHVLIRTGKNIGLSCDIENWQQIVALLWDECPIESRPKTLYIHHYQQYTSPDITTLSNLPITTIEQTTETTSLLSDMAKQAHQEMPSASLLTEDFAQEHHLSPVKKIWLLTGGMIAAALIISFLSTVTQFVMLKRQDNTLQSQITALYKQVYPASSSVVAPQIRMERTLKELQANQSGGGYLGLLALTGQVFKQLPALQINTLRYQDNKLVLEIQGNSFNALDLALNKLNQSGVIAQQDQGETKNNQVTARFTIQEKS